MTWKNIIENYVWIKAINDEVLNEAILMTERKIKLRELTIRHCSEIPLESLFDNSTQLHTYQMSFSTRRSPPIEAYEHLNSIEGVTVNAMWVDEANHYTICHYWPDEGHVVNLNPKTASGFELKTALPRKPDYGLSLGCFAAIFLLLFIQQERGLHVGIFWMQITD